MITGASLFHTLCLNIRVTPPNIPDDGDLPAWRRNEPVKAERYQRATLLQALTWQPRRIQLIPGAPGRCALTNVETPVRIHTMRFTAGAACDFSWTDPNVPYKFTEKGPMVLRPQEGKGDLARDRPVALIAAKRFHFGKK